MKDATRAWSAYGRGQGMSEMECTRHGRQPAAEDDDEVKWCLACLVEWLGRVPKTWADVLDTNGKVLAKPSDEG